MRVSKKFRSGIATILCLFLIGVVKPQITSKVGVMGNIDLICRGWPMPTGYVIVSVQFSQSCLGLGQGVQYAVSLAVDGLSVCNNLAIPSPYVVTSMSSSSKCGGIFDEAIIRRIADGMLICGDGFSPISDGYVVISAYDNDRLTCLGARIYRISIAASGAVICNFSPKPSGYVINRVTSSNQCLGVNAYVLQDATEGVVGCSFSLLPSGYVVTAGRRTNSCNDGALKGDYWTFNRPFSGIKVCPFSPIPVGYYIVGQVPKEDCYGASYGFSIRMM